MLPCLRRRLWAVVCVCGIVLVGGGTYFGMPFSFVLRLVECVAHRACASMTLGMLIKWLTLCWMPSTLLKRHS